MTWRERAVPGRWHRLSASGMVAARSNAAKDVVRNNFPYLHRRIWAHSVVARRLFSQLHGASRA